MTPILNRNKQKNKKGTQERTKEPNTQIKKVRI